MWSKSRREAEHSGVCRHWRLHCPARRSPLIPSELEYLVCGSALRTARAIHIRVVGVHERAFLAAENVVLTGGWFEPFAAKLVVNSHATQRRKEDEHVEEKQFVRGHGGGLAAGLLLEGISSVVHRKMIVPHVSSNALRGKARSVPATGLKRIDFARSSARSSAVSEPLPESWTGENTKPSRSTQTCTTVLVRMCV